VVVPEWTRKAVWKRLHSGTWAQRLARAFDESLVLPPGSFVPSEEYARHCFFGDASTGEFGCRLFVVRTLRVPPPGKRLRSRRPLPMRRALGLATALGGSGANKPTHSRPNAARARRPVARPRPVQPLRRCERPLPRPPPRPRPTTVHSAVGDDCYARATLVAPLCAHLWVLAVVLAQTWSLPCVPPVGAGYCACESLVIPLVRAGCWL
jgi:hypothetical protein